MTEERDILSSLAEEIIKLLAPLREAFSDEERFKGFLFRLGWGVNGLPSEYVGLGAAVANAANTVEDLTEGELEASEIANLVSSAEDLFTRIDEISTAPPGVNAGAFLSEIGERLFELLLTQYLADSQPTVFNLLSALHVIEIENIGATGDQHAFIRLKFNWDNIPPIFEDPLSIVKTVYGWGTDTLDTRNIFNHLSGLLYGLGLPVQLIKPDDQLTLEYSGASELPFSRDVSGLKIPFFYSTISGTPIELSVELLELPPAPGKKPGLVLQPGIPSVVPFNFELGAGWDLEIKLGSDIGSRFGVLIRPDGLDVKYPFQDSSSFPSAGFGVTLTYSPSDPQFLFGSPDGIRMQFRGAVLGFEVFSQSGEFEVKILTEMKELALILSAGNGDGFLQTLLGDGEIKVEIPLGIDWSSKTGFGFRGSMNFEIALHPHLSLGLIEIPQFQLSLGVPSDAPEPQVDIEASININANLGPLKAVIEEIGLGLYTTFRDGNLGPLNMEVGFKPPNGVGLSLDAGIVKGGGYLYFDFDKEEYAGILELDLSGIVSVKAIGLITTRLPDGSKGFSLLLIITAEFGSPIQLGFGFTLSGVGGLLGLNRTMRLEVIAGGIRDGGINSIMFPTNVIENAPRIISDLKNYFPVEDGTFLIGPMVKIGWGTPNLITVSLGIIIEIPGNIAILGVIKIALPTEEAALIVIQVNFIGAIEFDKSRLWFFAALFESRILFITLEGEMGLLVGWGDDPSFVVSVGGFHPAFNPPPLPFGAIARIAISILNTDFARIRIEGYFAVTSNSVQFGASVEIFFGVDAFNIDGHLAFDALFRFSPFYFIITISASLSVKVFGVGLFSVRFRGSLEGPTPWHVEGEGSISLLFFDISVDFSHTWGEEAETTLPPISVMPLLVAEYQKSENWLAVLPASNRLLVSIRNSEQGGADLILHPVGSLKVSQRAVPLGLTINKIGTQKPSDADNFNVTVGTAEIEEQGKVEELFAVGQYFDKSDSELLSAKSFEPMKGGIELSVAGDAYRAPVAVKRVVRYEKIIIDTNYKRFVSKFYGWFGSLFSLFLNGNAVSKSALSYKLQKELKPFGERVQVDATLYTVAFNHDNTAYRAEAMSFTSQVQAQEYMNQQIAADANLAKQLHVIPQVEMQSVE
jgi:hypothetical protein